MRSLSAFFRLGTRSLKSTLALYFIPIAVLPVLAVSFYAIRIFEDNSLQDLQSRAASERDAFLAEIRNQEEALFAQAAKYAASNEVVQAFKSPKPVSLFNEKGSFSWRLYKTQGTVLAEHLAAWDKTASLIPEEDKKQVLAKGSQLKRFFTETGEGSITVARQCVRLKTNCVGIVEGRFQLGKEELIEIKKRKQIDVLLLNRDLSVGAGSFALSNQSLKVFSRLPVVPGKLFFVTLGSDRFGVFLFELPAPGTRKAGWGYFALFLSMTGVDSSIQKLKTAIISITGLLGLTAVFFIFIFSNRIVRPIEMLVIGMKRIKNGRIENIPPIESAYEIEYLIQSFNEMSHNIVQARDALESKISELHVANDEIRNTQGAMVQNAKMISLGQIVAGVAHELNNPIGFIYSNMHHLSEYVERLQEWRAEYQKRMDTLPEPTKAEIAAVEKKLEIDFILKDIVELTRSCVEGAQRTKDIVLGLRSFSRMDEAGFGVFDLREGLKGTLKLIASEMRDRIRVHEELEEIPMVECNLSQLNQVFMNLLSNATQAITQRGDIWIRTKRAAEQVVVEIEDNGSGMSQEVVEKVFDPFFTTKKVGQGTGLGLSIAYGIIQKHHGRIEVQSKEGKGTLFKIYLPVSQALENKTNQTKTS